jgi:hypothetical protein
MDTRGRATAFVVHDRGFGSVSNTYLRRDPGVEKELNPPQRQLIAGVFGKRPQCLRGNLSHGNEK